MLRPIKSSAGWRLVLARDRPNNRPRLRPGGRLAIETLEQRRLLAVVASVSTASEQMQPLYQAAQTANSQGTVTSLATSGPSGYTPAQIRQAYGVSQISFAGGTVAGAGAGTTIAIVDAYNDPNIASDLHQFDLAFGLPDPTLTKVNQYGGTSMPAASASWSTEIALDVEWAHAIAPKANILLVEANDSSLNNLLTAVDYARNAAGVVSVSMSWGASEFSGETSYDSHFTTPAGHSGVTFFVASGDSGAPADYPAASPNVVSVGGTTLNLTSQSSIASETAWSGSTGGVSIYESQPAYQKGVVTQSSTARATPDVSYDANPNTGFPVYDSYATSSPWGQYGGTSVAAPQWAALVAIADQGRALAGEAALTGAQLSADLYQLPAADFHDITSGTSTGSPYLSASPGYDLVTGRGSPQANLLVSALVGSSSSSSAATHFSLAAPASSTAGGTFSLTVSALTASNTAAAGYTGTIHFSSSDVAAGLPADYAFTSADAGVHTFAGLKLTTAGNQTIVVTDRSTSSINGSSNVTVVAAAANHLVFVQQPTGAVAGAAFSPAVTVKVLDAYNNLATTDSTDQVTLSLGTNPTGGTLTGTLTTTVSGGVATFNNLAVNLAGNGYTLFARSGALTAATSTSFNVTTGAVTSSSLIDGFEGGNLSAYKVVGASTASASLSTSAAHDGSYGLLDSSGADWIYRNDSAAQVKPGEAISVWVQFSSLADGRAYFGFGATSTGTLALVAAPNTNQLILQDNSGYGYTNLAAVGQTWLPNHWYRLEVDWASGGSITGKVYDSNGTTLLQTVAATDTSISSGGIALRAFGSNKFWDSVSVASLVSSSATRAVAQGADTTAATQPAGGSVAPRSIEPIAAAFASIEDIRTSRAAISFSASAAISSLFGHSDVSTQSKNTAVLSFDQLLLEESTLDSLVEARIHRQRNQPH